MDFALKSDNLDKPRILKRSRIPFVTAKDKFFSGDVNFSEDRQLVNWKRWLEERKKQNRHIQSATNRSPVSQLHNSSEKFRAFVEMRNLMEQAAMPVTVDKYRGGPEFWRTPESLPAHGIICLPKVSMVLTKKDLKVPQDLTHVGLSELMMEERNLSELESKEEHWKRSEYLKQRKLELDKEIALLVPKESETGALFIQGHAFRKKKPEPRIPVITISQPDEGDKEELSETMYENINEATILKIQDREFAWTKVLCRIESVDVDPVMWSLIFTSEIDERVEREIVLENKGTRVILYHWRNSSFRSSYMSLDRRGSPFFFNKTDGLVLPGQIVKIKVWYQSRIPQIFTESWKLITEPKLSPSELVFRFWGNAIDNQNREIKYYRSIDEHLDRCVRDSKIRSIIEEIMDKVEQDKTPEVVYKTSYLQDELFNALNPLHSYCPSIMLQLQKIHHDVTGENASPWNLSLDILREIILEIGETNYRQDTLIQFNDLCKRCLKSNSHDIVRTKHNAVYKVLCTFANLFENESELASDKSLMSKKLPTPTEIRRPKSIPMLRRHITDLQETRRGKSSDHAQTLRIQKEKESAELRLQSYQAVFSIRIYKALKEMIEQVCIVIDSFNALNEINTCET